MKTLYVFCEGPTEQQFCSQVLAPHLYPLGFLHVPTVLVEFGRRKGMIYRGGVRRYAPVRRTIVNTMASRAQADVFFTTMLDLYGLPGTFPGKKTATRNPNDPYPYVTGLEAALATDINHPRFIPYLQLHEYETLLFAAPDAFAISFDDCESQIAELEQIAAEFGNIELINDGKTTAPSLRIIDILREYKGLKPIAGPDIATVIGMDQLRAKCQHFDAWVSRLETL